MDRNFLMMFILLTLLASITMYVNESGTSNQDDKAKAAFFDFDEQQSVEQKYPQDSKQNLRDVQAEQSFKKFTIEVLEVKETALLSRNIKARLTNNYKDVKDVEIRFELKIDDKRIKINGEDYITLYIGDMKRGESVERNVDVNIDFFDGIKIKDKGYVDVILTVFYDGGSETTKYRLTV